MSCHELELYCFGDIDEIMKSALSTFKNNNYLIDLDLAYKSDCVL